MPSGSRPLVGSSRMRTRRVAEQGRGQPEPLAHPHRVARRRACARRPGSRRARASRRRAAVGHAGGGGEDAQVVAAGATGVEVRRLERRADRRASGRGMSLVGAARDRRGARRRADQPEQHPQGRRLAGAVGPEEAGDPARLDGRGRVGRRRRSRRSAWSGRAPRCARRRSVRHRGVHGRRRGVPGLMAPTLATAVGSRDPPSARGESGVGDPPDQGGEGRTLTS